MQIPPEERTRAKTVLSGMRADEWIEIDTLTDATLSAHAIRDVASRGVRRAG